MPSNPRFLLKQGVAARGTVFNAGETKTAEELRAAGCDCNWLLSNGAIEMTGGGTSEILVTSASSKEEMMEEIYRLQKLLERTGEENDDLKVQVKTLQDQQPIWHGADEHRPPGFRPAPQGGPSQPKGVPAHPAVTSPTQQGSRNPALATGSTSAPHSRETVMGIPSPGASDADDQAAKSRQTPTAETAPSSTGEAKPPDQHRKK